MTYPEAIKYLESFTNYEKIPQWPYKESLKLECIKGFLKTIGDPQVSLKCLHIAGTKGKGSTCAFLTYILREAGYRVGLYTSPHLSDFRERIRIFRPRPFRLAPRPCKKDFEGMISKSALAALVQRLKPAIEKYNKNSKYEPLSFFEVYTVLAFVYFKEKKVDFAVLETGLGGRLDATNVVNPLVCAITSLSYEHTQKLGNTLREIAKEKAGIIKAQGTRHKAQGSVVITAPQKKEAMEAIRNRCKEAGAKLYEVGKDIIFRVHGSRFTVHGLTGRYTDLRIKLLGRHQVINAAVAIGVIEALRNYNIKVSVDSLRGGLYNTIWPGRCEVISRNPLVVLDGAQNVASSKALKKTIKESFSAAGGSTYGGKYKKLILVLGISSDKDIKGICQELCPLADEIILTQATNPRAASVDNIEKIIRAQGTGHRAQIIKSKNVKEAKERALDIAKKEDLILVTGSLFVVGEFRHLAGPALGIFSAANAARKHPSRPLND
jgi:dihydrofolate synthase/folylpolyglutamate synthase